MLSHHNYTSNPFNPSQGVRLFPISLSASIVSWNRFFRSYVAFQLAISVSHKYWLMVYKPRNKVGAMYVTEGGGWGEGVCELEHPRASLNTPLDWHHILLPPPYCCFSHYDSCPSPLPISLPPPLPPCITSLLTVPECVTQCTVARCLIRAPSSL